MSRGGTAALRVIRIALAGLALLLVFGTGAPVFRTDAWWIRLFDFPRIQIAVLLACTLVGYVILQLKGHLRRSEYVVAALAAVALVWQLVTLAPYTAFYPEEMATSRATDTTNRVSLLIYNVLSDNREVAALRDLIRETDPDIILLSEPTQWWHQQLDGLARDYPHTLFQPQQNHYGKLLYSRLALANEGIRFLIEPGIPSIRADVRLRSGTIVTLFGVHPRPPGLEEEGRAQPGDEREDSDVRDAELLAVATEVGAMGDAPVIVAGDFNDVGWSHTTKHFQRISGLLNPRIGRGFLNTFDATNRVLRYPLDHVFASRHFRLVEMRRLPDIGSDHFPVLVILDFDPDAVRSNDPPELQPGDRRDAENAIDKGKVND